MGWIQEAGVEIQIVTVSICAVLGGAALAFGFGHRAGRKRQSQGDYREMGTIVIRPDERRIQQSKREIGMKKLLIMLVLLGVVLSVTSCNMLKGAGKDIEDAGEAVQDAAK